MHFNLNGNSKGGDGPSLKQRDDEATKSELKRAKSLGEDCPHSRRSKEGG